MSPTFSPKKFQIALIFVVVLLGSCAARGTSLGVSVDPTLALDFVGDALGVADLSGTLGLNGPITANVTLPFLFADNSRR